MSVGIGPTQRRAAQAVATPIRDAAVRALIEATRLRGGSNAAINRLHWARRLSSEGAAPVWE